MNNLYESEAKELICPYIQDICRGQACIKWINLWFDRNETHIEFKRLSKFEYILISLNDYKSSVFIKDGRSMFACKRGAFNTPADKYYSQYMKQLEQTGSSESDKVFKIVDPIGYCGLGCV